MEHKPSTPSKNLSHLARLVLMVLLVLTGVQPLAAQTLDLGVGSDAPGQAFAPGQLLVRFRPWVPDRRSNAMLAAQDISHLRRIEALDVDLLRLPPDLPVEEAVELFGRLPEVEFAEPNYILRAVAAPAAEVEDQWGLQMIQAPPAWDLIDTPAPALLAVVDTGVDRTHSDLAGNIWANPGEIPDNGLDDDENGLVDDTWGWDFVNGDNDPLDDMMHGTAVSSLAAGVQDGAGVAGVCPWCQIVAVKVLNSAGSGTLDIVAEGIIYAADLGAQVINLSLGAAAGSQTLESAVDEAWDKGALVVAAAGNDGTEVLFYPAAYANAMAIAATNDQDRRACLSNYGEDFISVAAPGEAIETAIPGQGYGTYSGTSLAESKIWLRSDSARCVPMDRRQRRSRTMRSSVLVSWRETSERSPRGRRRYGRNCRTCPSRPGMPASPIRPSTSSFAKSRSSSRARCPMNSSRTCPSSKTPWIS